MRMWRVSEFLPLNFLSQLSYGHYKGKVYGCMHMKLWCNLTDNNIYIYIYTPVITISHCLCHSVCTRCKSVRARSRDRLRIPQNIDSTRTHKCNNRVHAQSMTMVAQYLVDRRFFGGFCTSAASTFGASCRLPLLGSGGVVRGHGAGVLVLWRLKGGGIERCCCCCYCKWYDFFDKKALITCLYLTVLITPRVRIRLACSGLRRR